MRTIDERDTREAIARSAARDAGNRSMREAGRTAWSMEDYNAAAQELNRLLPVVGTYWTRSNDGR